LRAPQLARPRLDEVTRIRIRYWAKYVARLCDDSPDGIDRRICAAKGIPYRKDQRANFFKGLLDGSESTITWAGVSVADILPVVEHNLGIKNSMCLYAAPFWDLILGKLDADFDVSQQIRSVVRRLGFEREPYEVTLQLAIQRTYPRFDLDEAEQCQRHLIQDGHQGAAHTGGFILDRAYLLALLFFEAHLIEDYWLAWSVSRVIADLSTYWWRCNGFGRDAEMIRSEFRIRILHMKLLDWRWKVDKDAAYGVITTPSNALRNREEITQFRRDHPNDEQWLSNIPDDASASGDRGFRAPQ
jgi:hypothetical protein